MLGPRNEHVFAKTAFEFVLDRELTKLHGVLPILIQKLSGMVAARLNREFCSFAGFSSVALLAQVGCQCHLPF